MVRIAHKPDEKTRKQVLALAGFGLTHDQIAKVMDLSDETLRKYYRSELDNGTTKLNAQVAQNLFSIATSKDRSAVTAAIFWLKTRARWQEVDRKEITGADGGPIALSTINLKGMNDEDLATMENMLKKVTPPA
jgi:orotate phosphoribosyltransferase-like protein